jgi:putative transposase
VTSTGRIEDLKVPRDRAGAFHTQVFERYNRYEPEVAEALTDMFISGTSTHRVGKVAEKLLGVAPSASAVSRLNQALTEQYEAWRERRLLDHYRIIYLDGIHLTVRHGTQTDATMILTALGVDLEGSREVLAFRACAEESKDGWSCLVQDLRSRGVTAVDLLVTDGHEGLRASVTSLFPATPSPRCLVHKQPSADERHSQTGAARGRHRAGGHLQAGEERGCCAESGREHSPNIRSAILKRCAVCWKTKSIG